MSIDSVCGRLVLDIEGALASVVIDIASTASIGGFARGRRRSVIDRPQALIDLVQATSPLHVAKTLGMIETQQDGEFREVHVATMAQHHFVTLIDQRRVMVILMTTRDVNVGLAWAQLHTAIKTIEPQIASWRAGTVELETGH